MLDGLGVEELVVIHFDEEFSHRTAEEFIDHALIEKLGARRVAVGENFPFGAKARGTPAMLAARPEFETRVQKLVEVDGETVSSSRIRAEIAAGDMEAARRCLGVPYMLEGEVVKGDQRGRELGFPTANLVPDPRLVTPGHGVYAAFANGHPAAVNVGVRPTFDSDLGVLIETYLIDFSGDLYGQTLRVAFVEKLRDEIAYEGVDPLVEQMHTRRRGSPPHLRRLHRGRRARRLMSRCAGSRSRPARSRSAPSLVPAIATAGQGAAAAARRAPPAPRNRSRGARRRAEGYLWFAGSTAEGRRATWSRGSRPSGGWKNTPCPTPPASSASAA